MAHISMRVVQKLWRTNIKTDWQGLRDAIEKHANGMTEVLRVMILAEIDEFEDIEEPYPQSAETLYGLLNEYLDEGEYGEFEE